MLVLFELGREDDSRALRGPSWAKNFERIDSLFFDIVEY
jgi:hypothetical protein